MIRKRGTTGDGGQQKRLRRPENPGKKRPPAAPEVNRPRKRSALQREDTQHYHAFLDVNGTGICCIITNEHEPIDVVFIQQGRCVLYHQRADYQVLSVINAVSSQPLQDFTQTIGFSQFINKEVNDYLAERGLDGSGGGADYDASGGGADVDMAELLRLRI